MHSCARRAPRADVPRRRRAHEAPLRMAWAGRWRPDRQRRSDRCTAQAARAPAMTAPDGRDPRHDGNGGKAAHDRQPRTARPRRNACGGSAIFTSADPGRALARLSRVPARLADAVNAADDAMLDRRPPGGGLSARETLALMADLELNVRWPAQAARILREDAPTLAPVERDIRVVEHAYRNQDARVSVGAFTMARKHLLTQLSRLAPADWERSAHAADGAALTLVAWAERLADEDDGYVAAIVARLADAPQ